MERNKVLSTLPVEIELLAKMHILYGLFRSSAFETQKKKVEKLISDYKINPSADLDPISRNLYRRYF